MKEVHPILDDTPFTDQTRRYHQLQDERAANWWRIALLLAVVTVNAVLGMAFQPAPWYKPLLFRIAITILIIEMMIGGCLLVADQPLRQHENSRTNLNRGEGHTRGTPDWTASFHRQTLRRSQMVYYIGSGLGICVFLLALWIQ